MQAAQMEVLVSVVENHKAVGSGWGHNQVIQPEEHATAIIDGCPPLQHFPRSLVLHGEIGAPLSTYNNIFVHVQWCLQEFNGQWEEGLSLSHRFPVAVASRGCCPCPSSSLGRHHSHNNPSYDSQSYQDTS